MATPGVSPTQRSKRESERRSRARRLANLECMRRTKDTLERAQLVLRTMDDHDAVWEDFLDEHTTRVRRSLRETTGLTDVVRRLTSQRTQLTRLLREHQLACATIERMAREPTLLKDWHWYVHHWREITKQYYRPWTLEECEDEMAAALKQVNAFQWSTDKQTSGLNFLGWREVRRVDPVRGTLQYQFHKTFFGLDIMHHVNAGWDTYTHEPIHNEVFAGPQVRAFLDVLQQPQPNIMIIRRVMRYTFINVDSHTVYLVFRIKTERGFTQCVRSIACPELMKATDEPQDRWPSNFAWMHWEHLDADNYEKGYRLRVGGSLDVMDITSAQEWMVRALACILRGEQVATRRKLLIID